MQPWQKEIKDHFYDLFPVLKPGYWASDYDEHKLNAYYFFSQIPPFSYHINYQVGKAQNEQYLTRYGMTPEDILYPGKLPGTSKISSAYAGSLNWVSSNINRLYR